MEKFPTSAPSIHQCHRPLQTPALLRFYKTLAMNKHRGNLRPWLQLPVFLQLNETKWLISAAVKGNGAQPRVAGWRQRSLWGGQAWQTLPPTACVLCFPVTTVTGTAGLACGMAIHFLTHSTHRKSSDQSPLPGKRLQKSHPLKTHPAGQKFRYLAFPPQVPVEG